VLAFATARAEARRDFQLTASAASLVVRELGGTVLTGQRRGLPGSPVFAAADDEVSDAPSIAVRVRARNEPLETGRLDMGAKERRVGTLYMGASRSERPEPRPRKGAS
jgi:hypothetical protein